MASVAHKAKKIRQGSSSSNDDDQADDKGGGGGVGSSHEEEMEEEEDEAEKERKKRKRLEHAAGPALRQRIEQAFQLPRVEVIDSSHRRSSAAAAKRSHAAMEGKVADEGGNQLAAVTDFVVKGGLPNELFVELMDMMTMKWDQYAYRGGSSLRGEQ